MRMTAEERIAAPRQRVWQALNDPQVLQQCIPGCQSLQKESDDRLRATVEIKIGPIGARFTCVVAISDIDPARSYTLSVEGQGGTVGQAKSTIKVRLADDGERTLLSYDVDAQVGGRLAQLGGPMIDTTAKQLATRFFKRFGEVIAGTPPATARDAPLAAKSASRPTSAGFPIAWMLAVALAALVGFLIGRGQSAAGGSDWMALAIALLIVIVAAAAFEYG